MNKSEFSRLILSSFPYEPTHSQRGLIDSLSSFIFDNQPDSLFVLKGYAGTGKTTIVSTFVKNLQAAGMSSVLLAPTGRAAKVFSSYSGNKAFTIHKKIYMLSTGAEGMTGLALAYNNHKNTIFMVDEASMIADSVSDPDGSLFSSRNLLNDLMNYVYSGKNCKMILIGDTAQLPPVGLDESPALNLDILKNSFPFMLTSFELTEVVRQSLDSGILANATSIRKRITGSVEGPVLNVSNFPDVRKINGEELEDVLQDAYSNAGRQESVVITRSNKRANIFNQEIRKRILYMEGELSAGDLLMVVKNNYYWLGKESKTGFIANGDILEIKRISKYEDFYGFRFAEVLVRFIDYPDEHDLIVKILLDTLMVDGPDLPFTENRKLFEEIMKDYEEIPSRRKKTELVKNNPFYNALHIKFAYALTCHKTQGGQWENVIIDQGYLKEDHIGKEYYRWLYTAFTRASRKLYLVNFNERFFN